MRSEREQLADLVRAMQGFTDIDGGIKRADPTSKTIASAEHSRDEAERQYRLGSEDSLSDMAYWAAYIDGASAQLREDLKLPPLHEGGQMSDSEILARIFRDIGNAEEAVGPDGLVILMSAGLLRRLCPGFALVPPSQEVRLFGCRVKSVPRRDLWWMVGIERNVTEEENG